MHVERLRENFDLFDFDLTSDEMSSITALDQGDAGRRGANPETLDWVPTEH